MQHTYRHTHAQPHTHAHPADTHRLVCWQRVSHVIFLLPRPNLLPLSLSLPPSPPSVLDPWHTKQATSKQNKQQQEEEQEQSGT